MLPDGPRACGANPKQVLHFPTRISTRRNLTRIRKHMATYISATALARRIGSTAQAVLDTAAALKLGAKGPHRNSPLVLDEPATLQIQSHLLEKKTAALQAKSQSLQAESFKISQQMGWLAPLARMHAHPCTTDLEELARLTSKLPEPLTEKSTYQNRVAYSVASQTLGPKLSAIQSRITAKLSKL